MRSIESVCPLLAERFTRRFPRVSLDDFGEIGLKKRKNDMKKKDMKNILGVGRHRLIRIGLGCFPGFRGC